MHLTLAIALASLSVSAVSASGGGGSCPPIWNTIAAQLTEVFVDPTTGQCTDLARGAIRMAFHDSCTWDTSVAFFPPAAGGADASLMLVPGEINRTENAGLEPYWEFINQFYLPFKNNVSAADLLYFAANHGVVSCPNGPTVKTVVGRQDNSETPSTTGLMPNAFGPGSDANTLVSLFENKTLSGEDLAALVGAHTSSKAFAQTANGIPVGGAQDDTPGIWDVDFYANTYNTPANVFPFDSDINLSQATNMSVGQSFKGFVGNQGKWDGKFADAMFRMSLLGIPSDVSANFIDCTNALPQPTRKRGFFNRPYNNRAR